MDERIQLAIFLLIFLALIGLVHYYVMNRFAKLFKIETNLLFYVVLVALSISYLIANLLVSAFENTITKDFYYLASVWLGFIGLAFFVVIIYDIINLIHPMSGMIVGGIMIGLLLMLVIYGVINAQIIRTTTINLQTDKLDKQLKIVQLSDLHIGPINNRAFLEKIVNKANALNPDMVFITGDLLDGRYNYSRKDFESLDKLKGKVYMITGNHEYYAGLDKLDVVLNKSKIVILRNMVASPNKNINIIGIDDAEDSKQVAKQLSSIKINNSMYNILLYHRPSGYKDATANHIDLMLVGHTHDGQFIPINLIADLTYGITSGIHHFNSTYLYVNSGAGTWGPPIRIGTKSEIAQFIVSPAN